jgi:hypothetical protein
MVASAAARGPDISLDKACMPRVIASWPPPIAHALLVVIALTAIAMTALMIVLRFIFSV